MAPSFINRDQGSPNPLKQPKWKVETRALKHDMFGKFSPRDGGHLSVSSCGCP